MEGTMGCGNRESRMASRYPQAYRIYTTKVNMISMKADVMW